MAEVVVLIGMPGVGKTTVGAALAARLGWRFVDTDDVIAERAGVDVATLINREGIDVARREERAAVAGLGSLADDTVIAVGGGTVIDPANRATLAALGRVIWLRATPATLLNHVAADTRERPLLASGAAEAIDRLLAERSELYASLASHVVDVEGRSPDEVADEVAVALGGTQ